MSFIIDESESFQVDAHVSKHLFHDCIKKYLAGKTTVLATHQLQYIKEVDGIILLEQGKMKCFSHYQDLLAYQPEYSVHLSEKDEETDELPVHKRMREQRISTSSTKVSEETNASLKCRYDYIILYKILYILYKATLENLNGNCVIHEAIENFLAFNVILIFIRID